MKIFISVMISGVMVLTAFLQLTMASNDGEKINAVQLFESKCSICHSINRPKSKKKTQNGWEKTVLRMKNKNGCPITDEEAKLIIDYLAETYGK